MEGRRRTGFAEPRRPVSTGIAALCALAVLAPASCLAAAAPAVAPAPVLRPGAPPPAFRAPVSGVGEAVEIHDDEAAGDEADADAVGPAPGAAAPRAAIIDPSADPDVEVEGVATRGMDDPPVPVLRPDLWEPTANAARTSPLPAPRGESVAPQAEEAGTRTTPRIAIAPARLKVSPTAKLTPADLEHGAPPHPAGPAATRKNGLPMGDVTLLGVFGAPGDRRALLRFPDGQILRVRKGDTVLGWKVVSIQDERLDMNRGDRRMILSLPRP